MKVLITGGAGFIGSHLVDAYLARGDEVVIIDDLSSGSEKNLHSRHNGKLQFYRANIRSEAAAEIILKEAPDLINHHAAQKSVKASVLNPAEDAETNILGLINILEASVKAGCSQFIFASSGGAIYSSEGPLPAKEDHPTAPQSPYGISKLCSEFYLKYYYEQKNLNSISLRYANIYGPRQDPLGEAGVVAIFLMQKLKNEGCFIYGNGKQTRDFVYVKDIVGANLAISPNFKGCLSYNVGTGRELSILELHAEVENLFNMKSSPEFLPARPGEQIRSALDSLKLKNDFNWSPQYSLAQGLKESFDWFSDRLNELQSP